MTGKAAPAPTPAEIRRECAKIRATWTPAIERLRRGEPAEWKLQRDDQPLLIPVVSTKYLRLAARDDGDVADG